MFKFLKDKLKSAAKKFSKDIEEEAEDIEDVEEDQAEEDKPVEEPEDEDIEEDQTEEDKEELIKEADEEKELVEDVDEDFEDDDEKGEEPVSVEEEKEKPEEVEESKPKEEPKKKEKSAEETEDKEDSKEDEPEEIIEEPIPEEKEPVPEEEKSEELEAPPSPPEPEDEEPNDKDLEEDISEDEPEEKAKEEPKKKGFFSRLFKKDEPEEALEEPEDEEPEPKSEEITPEPEEETVPEPKEEIKEPDPEPFAEEDTLDEEEEREKEEEQREEEEKEELSEEDEEIKKIDEEKEEAQEELEQDDEDLEEIEEKEKGFFGKLKEKVGGKKLSESKFEDLFFDLEIALLENNCAVEVIEKIKEDLKTELVDKKLNRFEIERIIMKTLKRSLDDILTFDKVDILKNIKEKEGPYSIVFVGINGSGKTTTIAKMAQYFMDNDLKVVLVAADTFRAAAIQQLEEHANNLNIKMIKHDYGSDPAAVAFDGKKYAESKDIDVVLIDTAGRLHSNKNLMDEMDKIIRVAQPDMKIFIGESITGNDCVEQANNFNKTVKLDGIVLSKADVDEKGGAAISVSYVTGRPILFLGTGQEYKDLEPFSKKKILANLGL